LPSFLCPTSTLLELLVWSVETAGPVYIKLSQWASTRRDFPWGGVHKAGQVAEGHQTTLLGADQGGPGVSLESRWKNF